jgi:hypothetical protein
MSWGHKQVSDSQLKAMYVIVKQDFAGIYEVIKTECDIILQRSSAL